MKSNRNPKYRRHDAREIRELIRVKIDITGLRQEDIDFLRTHAKCVLEQRS